MISFNYECDFSLENEDVYATWISDVIHSENKNIGEISYIFCDDEYLLEINKQYLNHDYYTDIITFNYNKGSSLNGEIYISEPRVRENAEKFGTAFGSEMRRVIFHGFLHLCGYDDRTEGEKNKMSEMEEMYLDLSYAE